MRFAIVFRIVFLFFARLTSRFRKEHVSSENKYMMLVGCLKCENIVKIECPQKRSAQRPRCCIMEKRKKYIYIKLFQTCCASSCLNSNKLDTTRSLTFFFLACAYFSIDNGKIQNCLYYISGQKYVHVHVCVCARTFARLRRLIHLFVGQRNLLQCMHSHHAHRINDTIYFFFRSTLLFLFK